MSRIALKMVADAITSVRAMDMVQKEALVDEIFRSQPNMLGSVLVLQRMDVSIEKMDTALDLLLICFQAMKRSGLPWPQISADDQDKQMSRYVATVRFGEDLAPAQSARAMARYIDTHPEKPLLTFVTSELNKWLARIVPEATDNYVMLASMNFVNCIAFIPIPKPAKRA